MGQTVFDVAESETAFDVLAQYIERGAKVHTQQPLEERSTDGQDQRTESEQQEVLETDLQSQSQQQETEDELIKVGSYGPALLLL